jgi:hypothetical protein
MKKLFILSLVIILALACASCAKPMEPISETSSEDAMTIEQSTLTVTEQASTTIYPYPTAPTTPEGFMPYPVTTAVSAKDQEAIDWMRLYLQNNKASFDLVAEEMLSFNNPLWSLLTNRKALSKSAQQALDTLDADFRKKFGQDIDLYIGAGGTIREDGRRAVHFSCITFGENWEELSRLLSYFPDGYAGFRDDTPYVDFGDGWYFYSGENP